MSEEEKKELKYIERFIRSMGLLKEANLISNLQKELDKKDKVINYIAKHTYIRTGENGVLGTITEEVIEHLYKKVEEENE